MNTKFVAFAIILSLTFLGIFSSCKKVKMVEEEIEEYTPIPSGKWQLVGVTYMNLQLIALDYSGYNIIYDFQKNGVLLISGEMEEIAGYRGHETGEYSYHVFPVSLGSLRLPTIKIGTDTLSFYYTKYNDLDSVMSLSSHKGGGLTLVRIEDL